MVNLCCQRQVIQISIAGHGVWRGGYCSPRELLHLWAHRLIGKAASYRLGDPFVTAHEPLSRSEKVFVLAMPFIVMWGIGILWLAVAVTRVVFTQLFANAVSIQELLNQYTPSAIVAFLFFVYGGASHGDLLAIAYLLFGKQTDE